LYFLSQGIIKKRNAQVIAMPESEKLIPKKEFILLLKIHKKPVSTITNPLTFSAFDKPPSSLNLFKIILRSNHYIIR